jgi:hypothetical protein
MAAVNSDAMLVSRLADGHKGGNVGVLSALVHVATTTGYQESGLTAEDTREELIITTANRKERKFQKGKNIISPKSYRIRHS